tara:strand:- start:21185 stop:21400 length:216 start_codon:yes stop_codon:yes gene_type:complete
MIIVGGILLILCIVFYMIAMYKNATVGFAPILGLMAGALLSYTDYDNEREYTLQCCFFIISMTVQWEEKNG